MPLAKARYDRDEEAIVVDGGGRLWVGETGGLVGARQLVSGASLSSLRAAVQRADYYLGFGSEVDLTLYEVDEALLAADEDAFNPPSFHVTVLPDRCLITCTVGAELGARFDRFEVTARLAPVLRRRKLVVLEMSVYEETAITVAHLTCEIRGRGRTLGDAAEAADDVLALWEATLGGGLSAATALDLLRAQRPELLVGQPEAPWLEAKRAPYRLDAPDQELELAKDVAAMANSSDGGLVVIGLATARRDGHDVVAKVRPVPMDLVDARVYRRVIDRLVYPPPEGMLVERIEVEPDKGLLVVAIPHQPPELRPLLVLGTVVGAKVVGSHVSIVRRRDDATIQTHPAALHSLIAAGRAALSGRAETSLEHGTGGDAG